MVRTFLTGLALSLILMVASACSQAVVTPGQPVALPTTYDVRVIVGEKYVNSQMLIALKNDSTLQNPTVDLLPPNRARGTATVNLKILGTTLSLRPSALMHFDAVNGRATMMLDSLDLGGFALPTNAIQSDIERLEKVAEDQINIDIQNAIRGTNLKLSGISATDDSLVIDFNE
ncbi:MAG TPA: hypothetical protein VIX58_00765 [Anaerolineae bacterium]